MGLLDVLNGMQHGPRGPSTQNSQTEGGGMSPMTMAILALLAWKAVKHFGGSQPGAASAAPKTAPPLPTPNTVDAGLPGGGLSDVLKGGLGGLLAGGAAGSVLSDAPARPGSWLKPNRSAIETRRAAPSSLPSRSMPSCSAG